MTWTQHEVSVAIFLGVLTLLSLVNLVGLRRVRSMGRGRPSTRPTPRVSILVPARNEETKIGDCLRSLLVQDYADFEILVLDDASEDRTGEIARTLEHDGRLRVLVGAPLLSGWLGKNWACHQLASAATGEVLLFTDADTRHHPQALADAVAALERERVDFLSVLSEQELRTWGERLVVPILPWSQHTFYPIPLLRRLRLPSLTTAVGQYMLFRRSAYDTVGGFERVKGSVLDDCDLVRAVARAGLRWTLLDGTGRVTTRMYGSFREAAAGFAKNLFARFRFNLPAFAFVWTWLLWVTWQPPTLLVIRAAAPARVPAEAVVPAALATGLSFFLWAVSDVRFRVGVLHVVLSPITVLVTYGIAARSVAWHFLRRGMWKGRPTYHGPA